MVKHKTYVLERMNMPFTIVFVRDNFDEILIEALNQVTNGIDKYLKKCGRKILTISSR